MGKEYVVLTSIILYLLVGCSTPPTPLPLLVQSSTPPVQPTLTVTTEPAIPTSTTEPSLRTDGPYFAYFREVDWVYQLVIMDADGKGRKIIQLPQEIANSLPVKKFNPDMKLVSPDGKWMAFYTGSAGEYGEMPTEGIYDLTLNLLNLATGKQQVVTPILSKDYPNNFVEAARKLNDPDITAESLHAAFISGITEAIGWSPDGKFLAFASQMNGLSSDLYMYDVETKTIQRLSSGDQELQWISWSPDGKWILHGSVFWVGMGMTFDIYAAAADRSSVRYLSTSSLNSGIQKWVNSHIYLENDAQNGPGRYGLRSVAVDTGKITKIWDGSYHSYAVDKDGKRLALIAFTPADMSPYEYDINSQVDFSPGLYSIDLATLEKFYPEPINGSLMLNYLVDTLDVAEQSFVLTSIGLDQKPYFLSAKDELTALDLTKVRKIKGSTDSRYWIAVTDQIINVYSVDNTLINSFPLPLLNVGISDLIWRPDASGLFLVYDTSIYSVNISNGETQLIETKLMSSHFGPKYIWIGNQ